MSFKINKSHFIIWNRAKNIWHNTAIEELENLDVKFSVSDLTEKAKLETIKTSRFDKNSFSIIILGFNPYWDYKLSNTFTGNKTEHILTFDRNELKCDCMDGGIVNGVRQSTFSTFCFGSATMV